MNQLLNTHKKVILNFNPTLKDNPFFLGTERVSAHYPYLEDVFFEERWYRSYECYIHVNVYGRATLGQEIIQIRVILCHQILILR